MSEPNGGDYLFEKNGSKKKECLKKSLRGGSEVKVTYQVDEIPPLMVSFLLGFQHYISLAIAAITVPILLAPAICMHDDHIGKSELTGTLFVVSGIITTMQTLFGIRLPIVQAGCYAILVPTLSYLSLPEWQCPTNFNTTSENGTYIVVGSEEHREIWMSRLREIQGCIMLAALFEVLVGMTGLVGFMMKYIGPLTICPTVTLIGLSLFKSAPAMASKYWPAAILVFIMMVVFSQYLGKCSLPCFLYSRDKKCYTEKFKIFKMFPIVLAILIAWFVCYILTISDYFPSNPSSIGYHARTDLRSESIQAAPWFRFPYPLQWGIPTYSISGVCAILSGVVATIIESVGDYHSCARLSGANPPPVHAINRGIMVEGLGSMLAGLFGTGNGSTSSTINVGVIGITKVGSRIVVQISALIMCLFGFFIKVGAVFLSIPDPVVGGIFFVLFGLVTSIGLSNLQRVNMNSSRNIFIIGCSIFIGMALPEWISSRGNIIDTGIATLDNVLFVLLKTQMFVGGFLGFVLDNSIPGSRKMRGMEPRQVVDEPSKKAVSDVPINDNDAEFERKLMLQNSRTYDLPRILKPLFKYSLFRMFPFCPSYRGYIYRGCEGCGGNRRFERVETLCARFRAFCNKYEDEEDDEEAEQVEMVVVSNSEKDPLLLSKSVQVDYVNDVYMSGATQDENTTRV